ncbi:MAG TPA: hypothetical protein VF730_10865, partial [Terracidiphilus sp.]
MSTSMPNRPHPIEPGVAEIIKREALASLTHQQTASTRLSIAPHIFPQGHTFNLVDTKMVVREPAALVFIDRMPQANWGHPCTYRFCNPRTGSVLYEEDALFPPNLAGERVLEIFHQPILRPRVEHAALADMVSQPGVLPLASQALEQRYAILWTSQISDLRHVEDLEFLWRALVNVYGFSPNNIYVLCYNGTIGAVDVS